MLWYRETYAVTAGDAGGTFVTRLLTPDGINHDPLATGKSSRREDWRLHYLHVWVLKTTTGCLKPGLVGELVIAMEDCRSFIPLPLDRHHKLDRVGGLVYAASPPIVCTHGFGWTFYKGALADTDKVYMRALYELKGKGA